jgi:hypothetical protein
VVGEVAAQRLLDVAVGLGDRAAVWLGGDLYPAGGEVWPRDRVGQLGELVGKQQVGVQGHVPMVTDRTSPGHRQVRAGVCAMLPRMITLAGQAAAPRGVATHPAAAATASRR